MDYAIIISKKDLAGLNIYDKLIKKNADNIPNAKIFVIEEDTVELKKEIKADCIIFATRHQSKSGEKTLSVHFPGNFNKAEYGGRDRKLCMSSPLAAKHAFQNLNMLGKNLDYIITLESTHHGPFLKKPCFFIEIGSKKEQWQDHEAAEVIAETIIKTIIEFKPLPLKIAIGFGGLHYCANFNKVELESQVALSHICPKYNIESLDEEMVLEMINSTDGKVSYALLDWKGLNSEQKEKLFSIFKKINLDWKKTKDIK